MGQQETDLVPSGAENLEVRFSRLPADVGDRRSQGDRILGEYIKWLKELDRKNSTKRDAYARLRDRTPPAPSRVIGSSLLEIPPHPCIDLRSRRHCGRT
jgi:hypothetical protein